VKTQLNLGDSALLFAMWLWLTVAVGPFWLGAVLFGVAWLLNLVGSRVNPRPTPKRPQWWH